MAATNVSFQTLVMELSPVEERPTYLGLSSTFQAPFALISPFLAAGLADYLGLWAVFVAAGLLSGATVLLYLWRVEEPRHRSPG